MEIIEMTLRAERELISGIFSPEFWEKVLEIVGKEGTTGVRVRAWQELKKLAEKASIDGISAHTLEALILSTRTAPRNSYQWTLLFAYSKSKGQFVEMNCSQCYNDVLILAKRYVKKMREEAALAEQAKVVVIEPKVATNGRGRGRKKADNS
jgi:hypothetical protein